MREVLRPACLSVVDARTFADATIRELETAGNAERLQALVRQAECAGRLLTPTTIAPTLHQQAWALRFHTRTLELPTLRVIEQLVQTLRCGFIDVGAHVGYFAAAAVEWGAEPIIAIEMHPPNWRLLKANVPAARCLMAAAGEVSTEAEYFVGLGHSNHSLNARPDTSEGRAVVQVVTLDDLTSDPTGEAFGVVKIDVQGHETAVLRGFQAGLAAGWPILVFEVERNDGGPGLDRVYEDALELLQHCRYRIFCIGDRGLVEIDGPADPSLADLPISSNVLAVSAHRFAAFDEALHRR